MWSVIGGDFGALLNGFIDGANRHDPMYFIEYILGTTDRPPVGYPELARWESLRALVRLLTTDLLDRIPLLNEPEDELRLAMDKMKFYAILQSRTEGRPQPTKVTYNITKEHGTKIKYRRVKPFDTGLLEQGQQIKYVARKNMHFFRAVITGVPVKVICYEN